MVITTPVHKRPGSDYVMFKGIIDQGIDSHLEAFTESTFEEKIESHSYRLHMDFQGKDIAILIRRLYELKTEQADDWANDIEWMIRRPNNDD